MTDAKLRWGVLGAANIAVKAMIPAIRDSAELGEVVAIASRDRARATAVAADLGIPRAHGSYEALLADPEVDAIYNPLPNHLHASWTMRAADAGKHVLCEKPLACDAAEARQLVQHCATAGVALQEAFMYRFHPQWVRVRELVDARAIGEPVAIHTWFSYFNRDPDNVRNVAEYGGGALMDIGCYAINLSRMLFHAEPDGVSGAMAIDPQFGVDAVTSAALRFGDRHATFTCSTQAEPFQRVEVVGTRGRIEVERPFNTLPDRPSRIFVTSRGEPPGDPDTVTVVFEPADHYALVADAFAGAVLAGEPVPLPPSDAAANMAVIDALAAAARRG